MTRQLQSHLSLLLVALMVFTGCHATQPFYFNEDGDLSHYLDRATELENADVYEPRLAEVENAMAPFTLSNPEPNGFWDLTLEEIVATTLHNSKIIRTLGSVTQFGFADGLVGRTGNGATIYDPALVESDPQAGVEATLAAFDALFSVTGTSGNGNFVNRTDRPSTFGAGAIVDQMSGGLRTELSKRSAGGTQFFARNITEYTRGNTILGVNQPIGSLWQTTMELEARQPILQGRGTLINRIPVFLARINTDVSLAQFESSIRNLLLDVENTYWDLHLAYRNLETARIGRDSAQITWKQIHEKWLAGVVSTQEELQSKEQYFFFRAQTETAQRDLFNTEGRLRFMMGLSPTDGRIIRPVDEPTSAAVEFDWQLIHEEALARSAELRQQKWLIQRRELELVAARNQLLPQFDLGATYRWFGIGDHLINADRNGLNFPEVGSTAFDVLTEGRFQEGAFFMSFQMPVGFRRALSGVRNAQLALVRDKDRLEDMELNVTHLLSTSLRNLDSTRWVAQTQFMRWSTAVQEVGTAQILYDGGKVTLDVVLDAQRRRAQAQIDYYRAIVDYNKSIADIHFRKGSLFEYNNVHLSEGPWPDKAYWDAVGRARQRDASYYLDYGWSRPRVISQGPVPENWDQTEFAPTDINPLELIPPGTPTPAKDLQHPKTSPQLPGIEELPESNKPEAPKPRAQGPITKRPDGLQLNPPARRVETQATHGMDTAQSGTETFDWGTLREKASPSSTGNPLRQASYEE